MSGEDGSFINNYKVVKEIGEGNFGKVKLCVDKLSGEKYAIKILNKKKLSPLMREKIFKEIEILTKLNHINIVYVYQVLEDELNYYIVMEYCEKGELFNYIVKKEKLDEIEASVFFYQLINGIDYLHQQGIAHRDIKPENLLLGGDNVLKIIDFGLSHEYNDNILLKTKCGSPSYAAPEILKGELYDGFKCDVWSSGVTLFAMICGFLPFDGENNKILFKNIIKCKLEVPTFLSECCQKLLKDILKADPNDRLSIDQIKESEFFLKGKKNCDIDYKLINKKIKEERSSPKNSALSDKKKDNNNMNDIEQKIVNKKLQFGSQTNTSTNKTSNINIRANKNYNTNTHTNNDESDDTKKSLVAQVKKNLYLNTENADKLSTKTHRVTNNNNYSKKFRHNGLISRILNKKYNNKMYSSKINNNNENGSTTVDLNKNNIKIININRNVDSKNKIVIEPNDVNNYLNQKQEYKNKKELDLRVFDSMKNSEKVITENNNQKNYEFIFNKHKNSNNEDKDKPVEMRELTIFPKFNIHINEKNKDTIFSNSVDKDKNSKDNEVNFPKGTLNSHFEIFHKDYEHSKNNSNNFANIFFNKINKISNKNEDLKSHNNTKIKKNNLHIITDFKKINNFFEHNNNIPKKFNQKYDCRSVSIRPFDTNKRREDIKKLYLDKNTRNYYLKNYLNNINYNKSSKNYFQDNHSNNKGKHKIVLLTDPKGINLGKTGGKYFGKKEEINTKSNEKKDENIINHYFDNHKRLFLLPNLKNSGKNSTTKKYFSIGNSK